MPDSPQSPDRTTPEQTADQTPAWMRLLYSTVALLMAGLVAAPMALSGQDIMDWARDGLNLSDKWPWVVFYSLDATAAISVLVCFYCAWQGQRAGLFQITAWAIAGISGFAQYRNGDREREFAPDAWWFFPLMALIAPFMLELLLAKVREVQLRRQGRAPAARPKFGILNWIPGIGSFTETYGAWRVSRLLNIPTYDGAVRAYRDLCPSGGVKVLAALRARQMADQANSDPNPDPDSESDQQDPEPQPPPSNWRNPDQDQEEPDREKADLAPPPNQDEKPDPEPGKAKPKKSPRRTVNLYTSSDRTYMTAIAKHKEWPKTSLEDIQDIVKELCPTGKCGKSRAIRLRDKTKEFKS